MECEEKEERDMGGRAGREGREGREEAERERIRGNSFHSVVGNKSRSSHVSVSCVIEICVSLEIRGWRAKISPIRPGFKE
jgi:hypothetical protein